MSLMNKVALITGASGGIGAATAIRLAGDGADVFVSYNSDLKGVQATQASIEKLGRRCWILQCDLATDAGVDALVEAVYRQAGKVDILVNNAGICLPGDFFTYSIEDFDRTISVCLRAVFLLCQKIGLRMSEQKIRGRIINIASAGTIRLTFVPASYCIAKEGVNALTRSLACPLGEYGITINAIQPGPTPTKINKHQFDDPVVCAQLLRDIRVLREDGKPQVGRPEDIAAAIAFYASEDAGWITGTTIEVDGGWTIG